MGSRTLHVLVAFFMAIAFVLTSAKKTRKKKSAENQIGQIVPNYKKQKPAETVTTAPQNSGTESPASGEAASSESISPGTTEVTPAPATTEVIPDPNTQVSPSEIPTESSPPVIVPPAKTETVLKETKNEPAKKVEEKAKLVGARQMQRYKVKLNPPDDDSTFTAEEKVEDLTKISNILRPFFVEKYSKSEYEQQQKNANEYLQNPGGFGFQKAAEAKKFIEEVKSKHQEIATKGEAEVVVPKDEIPSQKY